MVSLVLAATADTLGFLLAASYFGVGGESNPFARFLYENWGVAGIVGGKVAVVGLLATVPSNWLGNTARRIATIVWTLGAFTAVIACLVIPSS